MGTPLTIESKMLLRYLADGQWHSVADAVAAVGQKVAPGVALRFYDQRLEYRRRHANTKLQEVVLSEDRRIELGQKGVAERAVQRLKRHNIEIEGSRENRRLRLRPGAELPASVLSAAPGGLRAGESEVEVSEGDLEEDGLSEPDVEGKNDTMFETAEDLGEVTQADVVEAPIVVACDRCGMVVDPGRLDDHEQWHAQNNEGPRQEMALFAESEVRELIRTEVQTALDEFQVGLQAWLVERFAEVERQVLLSRARALADSSYSVSPWKPSTY